MYCKDFVPSSIIIIIITVNGAVVYAQTYGHNMPIRKYCFFFQNAAAND